MRIKERKGKENPLRLKVFNLPWRSIQNTANSTIDFIFIVTFNSDIKELKLTQLSSIVINIKVPIQTFLNKKEKSSITQYPRSSDYSPAEPLC